ncbi:MAG: 3-oxoacyl-ACP reductase FabG [Myxococcaceae bacterium]|nr:3-oxoacyl-ACP reductase FabG [Myxococcaceae bacterium]
MKQVLVTGASRGIGAAAARALAAAGFRVWLHYRSREEAARQVAREIVEAGGVEPYLVSFDLSRREEAHAATARLVEELGAPDALVVNGGITHSGMFALMDDASWDGVMGTNLGGFFAVARPVIKSMLRQRKGRLVLLSSVAAQRGNPGQVAYAASKGGLIAAARSLALELAPRSITVNVVAPGLVETEMLEGAPVKELLAYIPAGRVGRPEEVAHVIRYLCSDEAAYVTGQVIGVNGGMWM